MAALFPAARGAPGVRFLYLAQRLEQLEDGPVQHGLHLVALRPCAAPCPRRRELLQRLQQRRRNLPHRRHLWRASRGAVLATRCFKLPQLAQ